MNTRHLNLLLGSLITLGLAACATAQAASLPAPAASGPTTTPLPTRRPTATAMVFELLPSSTPIPTETPFPTPLPHAVGPDDFPAGTNPLTGLAVSDPALLERRPMAVKITNFPRSVRPQYGLTLADHVYEYYLEASLTRFAAIFYGQDAERVGPVRSGRKFDEHLMRMYKAALAFAAADARVLDPWVESDLKNLLVIERPTNCPPMCRIGNKEVNYNTLFTNTSQLSAYLTERGTSNERQDLRGLAFDQFIPPGGRLALQLDVRYSFVSYNTWQYDPSSERYLRFQETQDARNQEPATAPLIDALTGEQISAANLVVLLLPHSYFLKSSDTEIFEIHLTGSGAGYALRDGYSFPITWQREAPEALVRLYNPSGQPYRLKPGNTWFQVLSDRSTFELGADDNTWQTLFVLPEAP